MVGLPSLPVTVVMIGGAHRVEIPDVVRDILEMTDVLPGVEVKGNERIRVEIVSGPHGAIKVRRRIADHEIDAIGLEIDRGILPDASAQGLERIAGLGELCLLGRDVAMHVAPRGVLLGPDAHGIIRDRVERPDELSGLGVEGLQEAPDPVFAAVRAEQDLSVHRGRRHGLAVSELRIRDVRLPSHGSGLGIERDELGVEGREIDHVAIGGDAAIVRAAAIGRDRAEFVLVMPELLASPRVQSVDMAEGCRDIHHPIHDERRGLERFLDLSLENPGWMQARDICRVDLRVRIIASLPVIAVGEQEIIAVAFCAVEKVLRDGGHVTVFDRALDLLGGCRSHRHEGDRESERARDWKASANSNHYISSTALFELSFVHAPAWQKLPTHSGPVKEISCPNSQDRRVELRRQRQAQAGGLGPTGKGRAKRATPRLNVQPRGVPSLDAPEPRLAACGRANHRAGTIRRKTPSRRM